MPRTKVFLTWSGKRSEEVAKALRKWLPKVIQNLDPWMSEDDIDKGTRWGSEISAQLQQAKIGIICLTPENLPEPWINFEAGALSKLEGSYVCTYLLDLATQNVPYPLAQFQSTKADKEDTRKLLQTINKTQGDDGLSVEQLNEVFDKWWPDLNGEINQIVKAVTAPKPLKRSSEEVLEELVSTVRENTHAQSTVLGTVGKILEVLNEQRLSSGQLFSRADFSAVLSDALMGIARKSAFAFGPLSSSLSTEEGRDTPLPLKVSPQKPLRASPHEPLKVSPQKPPSEGTEK